MAEKYISEMLTAEERDVIEAARSAEDFRDTAWEQYGADWIGHVPTAINSFVYYYFNCILFPYQLGEYYCPYPITEITVHGGRGSGKTDGVALALMAYHALHPGENWIHLSITKDQSKRAYDAIMNWGGMANDRVRFTDRFIKDAVTAPFPEIRLYPWSPEDPGTIVRFRSLGDENIERLRSLTAGTISVDEAFRDVQTDATYAQLRGCLRGVNQFRLNLLPKGEQEDFRLRMYKLALIVDPKRKEREKKRLNTWLKERGLNIRGLMLLQGNAGPNDWEWERHERGNIDPAHYWSITVTSHDNPFFGEENIKALERSFGENKELMEVEMLAKRPANLGSVFEAQVIKRARDDEALPLCRQMVHDETPGWTLESHAEYGIFRYYVPPIHGHLHVFGSDPGSGKAPGRNKWVILIFDITELPCRLVGFEMGYLSPRQTGNYMGYIQRIKDLTQMYPTAPGDVWVESTGPQKGMVQVAWPEGVTVTPVEFQASKLIYINFARQLMASRYIRFPAIQQLLIELGNYDYQDKELNQDCVMALICAAGGIWQYHQPDAWQPPSEDSGDEPEDGDRYGRLLERPLRRSVG
jgi:hypothetical protein